VRDGAELIFVTHSFPLTYAQTSAYVPQHEAVAQLVADRVAERTGRARTAGTAGSSSTAAAAGRPRSPGWSRTCATTCASGPRGREAVVLAPIGFVSDHMEVIYDLDTQASEVAAKLGLPMARAATPGVAPGFVAMVRDLLTERAAAERGEQVERPGLSALGPKPDICAAGCCPNPRGRQAGPVRPRTLTDTGDGRTEA
jgi:ferrochelatase